MFSIALKPLDIVNVVLGSLIDKYLGVINHQMLTKALQRLIASVLSSSGIRKVNRALAGMVLDMGHEDLNCCMKERQPQPLVYPGNGLGIQAQITSQSISRLLLIKALQDGNLAAQLERLFAYRRACI